MGRTCKLDSASCSLGWQSKLILVRSPSEDVYVKDHCVLGIKQSARIKAILLLGSRGGLQVGTCTNVLGRNL